MLHDIRRTVLPFKKDQHNYKEFNENQKLDQKTKSLLYYEHNKFHSELKEKLGCGKSYQLLIKILTILTSDHDKFDYTPYYLDTKLIVKHTHEALEQL